MNLRCLYCQTPFTLSRAEMLTAIVNMNEKNQNHYDAHCPRCRRANSISRQRMELFFPNWKEAAKQQAAAPAVKEAAPVSTTDKTEPLPKTAKKTATTTKKTTAKKETTEKKPAAKKTTSAKKPAEKSTTKATKTASDKTKKK